MPMILSLSLSLSLSVCVYVHFCVFVCMYAPVRECIVPSRTISSMLLRTKRRQVHARTFVSVYNRMPVSILGYNVRLH